MPCPTLQDERVKLSLLDLNNYKHLLGIAKQDNLLQYTPESISTPEDLKLVVLKALDAYYHETAIPFIIYDKKFQAYAGSTRYMNIDHKNSVLEIGFTWIGREFQGTGLNAHMKLLMLEYAFETLNFEKVQFRVDERNTPSRKAIEKLNAIHEGTLRKNILMLDGFKRNTCIYGILKEEWPPIKKMISNNLIKTL